MSALLRVALSCYPKIPRVAPRMTLALQEHFKCFVDIGVVPRLLTCMSGRHHLRNTHISSKTLSLQSLRAIQWVSEQTCLIDKRFIEDLLQDPNLLQEIVSPSLARCYIFTLNAPFFRFREAQVLRTRILRARLESANR